MSSAKVGYSGPEIDGHLSSQDPAPDGSIIISSWLLMSREDISVGCFYLPC